MTDYAREWTSDTNLPPGTRLRLGLTKQQGHPQRFLVQLEYWHAGMWLQVARFDHDAAGPAYRNVERSGLHMDVYDAEGRQIYTKTDFPPVDLRDALDYAEGYLRAHRERLVRRFERDL